MLSNDSTSDFYGGYPILFMKVFSCACKYIIFKMLNYPVVILF